MRRRLLAGLLLGLALGWAGAQAPKQAPPIGVVVSNGSIVLSDTGLVAPGATTFTWVLATKGYRFTSGSIDFGAQQGQFTCTLSDNDTRIACARAFGAQPPRVYYAVSVVADPGHAPVPGSGPTFWVQND